MAPRRLRTAARHACIVAVVGVAAVSCGSSDSSTGVAATAPAGSAPVDAARERITIGGSEALVWGSGPNGVVLAHGSAFDAASWQPQATEIAAAGFTVVAVEDTRPDAIEAAVSFLRTDRGIDHVTLMGGSSGADAILRLVSARPDLPDALILLSANTTVDGLGDQPKLFIASEDEPGANVSTVLAQTSPGDHNVALLLPGSAHAQHLFESDQADAAMQAILDRLAGPAG